MKMSLRLLTLLLSLCLIFVKNIETKPFGNAGIDAEEAANQDEGDMLLSDLQREYLKNGINGRNGLVTENKRWPNNLVYYKFVGDFDRIHLDAIHDAIETLELKTCLRFVEADESSTKYVAISSEPKGCYSHVGYFGKVQTMNLQIYPIGEGCFRPGTILHEFMHVLGFFHQQSSSIRDDFVTIVEANIIEGKEFNFEKYSSSQVTDFEVGYDYDSCLHYRPGAFSSNGLDTIIPLQKGAIIGQRRGLSSKDVKKINIMYKCPIEI